MASPQRGVRSRGDVELIDEAAAREATLDEDGYRTDAHAVVVGIDKYVDPLVKNLEYARADAEALYNVLTDSKVGRFRPDNVMLLVDEEATEANILTAMLTELPRRASAEDTVVLFFAGHGAPAIDRSGRSSDGMEKYLVPFDAQADNLRVTGIEMGEFERVFRYIDSRQVLLFLDTCYSGTAGGRTFPAPNINTRANISDEFLQKLGAADSRMVVTACAPNEVSLETDERGHGLFTYHLTKGLRGAADTDGDGLVTLDELYDYLSAHVADEARTLGGRMTPMRSGSVSGRVYLAHYGAPRKKHVKKALPQEAAGEAPVEEVTLPFSSRVPSSSFWTVFSIAAAAGGLGVALTLFNGDWDAPVAGIVAGAFFLLGGFVPLAWRWSRRSRRRAFEATGQTIQTTLIGVEVDTSRTLNGKHPYRIETRWRNPQTGERIIFESDCIYFDPTDYAPEKIRVIVDPENPSNYAMDVSYLPRRA